MLKSIRSDADPWLPMPAIPALVVHSVAQQSTLNLHKRSYCPSQEQDILVLLYVNERATHAERPSQRII